GRLVSKVVPPEELLPTARALAKEIAAKTAPVSVALIRQMMWRMLGADDPLEDQKIDSRGIYTRVRSDDVKEGVVSFLEKRPAQFKNKVSADMPDYFPWWDEREYERGYRESNRISFSLRPILRDARPRRPAQDEESFAAKSKTLMVRARRS